MHVELRCRSMKDTALACVSLDPDMGCTGSAVTADCLRAYADLSGMDIPDSSITDAVSVNKEIYTACSAMDSQVQHPMF